MYVTATSFLSVTISSAQFLTDVSRKSSQMIKHGHFQDINKLGSHPRNQDTQSTSNTVSTAVLLGYVSPIVLVSPVEFNTLVCEIRKKPHILPILPSEKTSFHFIIIKHSNFSLIFGCL